MRTILSIKQQADFLALNGNLLSIEHKYSTRGMGNSKILDIYGDVLAKASGCGYDRFGAAIGGFIQSIFYSELKKLALRECKGPRLSRRKTSEKFYDLFYNSIEKRAYVDGACGADCMKKILNAIGFELMYVNESKKSGGGSEYYKITPVTARARKYLGTL